MKYLLALVVTALLIPVALIVYLAATGICAILALKPEKIP